MNMNMRREAQVTLYGLSGRAASVIGDPVLGIIRRQLIVLSKQLLNNHTLTVTLQFDNKYNNNIESFSITGELLGTRYKGNRAVVTCGAIHDTIEEHMPELAHLTKWHLCNTDGPMHYIANTTYLAGDRDHHGLREGERRQIVSGKTGLPSWELVVVDESGEEVELYKLRSNYVYAVEQPPCSYRMEYRPWCRVGEGKARDFEGARKVAIWQEATDEQLSLPREELTDLLIARLPDIQQRFKRAMLDVGFLWPERAGY